MAWNEKRTEKMEVRVPEKLDIVASGTVIGEMYKYGNNPDLYTVMVTQKVYLNPFLEMMGTYWATQGRTVKDILINNDDGGEKDTYFSVYLNPIVHANNPRVIRDNPQA